MTSFDGQFAECGLGAGKIAIRQAEIGQHDARGERRQVFNAQLRGWSIDRR